MPNHKKLITTFISEGVSPWNVSSRGKITNVKGTTGFWMKSGSITILWIYKSTDNNLTESQKFREFTSFLPSSASKITFFNPWTGDQIGVPIPIANFKKLNIYDEGMDKVTPEGFGERIKEDIILIVE